MPRTSCFFAQRIHTKPPIEPGEGRPASVLVLGSMHSVESLRKGEYYGHAQNAFWRIMMLHLGHGEASAMPYDARCQALRDGGIVLWDVLASCERKGSLDSAIREPVVNDIRPLLERYPDIDRILFNGATSRRFFHRDCRALESELLARGLRLLTMPSTSPAYASKRFDAKYAEWHAALA